MDNQLLEVEDTPLKVDDTLLDVDNKLCEMDTMPLTTVDEPLEKDEKPLEIEDMQLETDNKPREMDNEPPGMDDKPIEVDDSLLEIDNRPVEIDDTQLETDNKPAQPDNKSVDKDRMPFEIGDVYRAETLIQDIRKEKRVDEDDGNDENANDLQNALRLLSEELYSKPTHFILELIQNADDNKYNQDVTPTLSIIFRSDGHLWIGCNEVGFSPANVRAICRIGGSTKKVEGSRKGYIGEKGIGFKSVFKVAQKVWISSGALQFMFDAKKKLGMIAPIPCQFKAHALLDARTAFCFKLKDASYHDIVENDLLKLEPELLLFLRQLRAINVRIEDSNGDLKKSFNLQRRDVDSSALDIISLSRYTSPSSEEDINNKYVVCRHTAEDMPHEPKREGVTQSDVMIAFPITTQVQPQVQSCLTFNFLPVRSYGLPFVLQGDFILSANREDVLQDHAWNQALLRAAEELFIGAVQDFNKQAIMKHTWPRYLASQHDAHETAFSGFLGRLLKRVKSSPVIESLELSMEAPAEMQCVPEIFQDISGKPLLAGPRGMQSYPSAEYDSQDLSALNLKVQSEQEFLSLLRIYIDIQHANFKQQPPAWHARVAKAISSMEIERIRDLRIIPLRSGTWTSAATTKLYFSNIDASEDNKCDLQLPPGININTIDDSAAKDRLRSKLFMQLGARPLNPAEVYRIILDQHRDHGKHFGTWTVDCLIAHAWFLFTSPAQPANCDVKLLRLASQDSAVLHFGPDLYADSPETDIPLSHYFGVGSSIIHYIHGRYLTYAEKADSSLSNAWIKWLRDKLGVRTVPRLLQSDGTISREFQYIIDFRPGNQWLLLLKSHWSQYVSDLSSRSIKDALSQAKVKCSDGQRLPLKDVFLASSSITEEPLCVGRLPMLDVQNGNDPVWAKFHVLGLNTRPNLQFYLRILKSMRADADRRYTDKDFSRVYQGINRNFKDDPKLVKTAFAKERLIFVPLPNSSRWIGISECRWTAPECMRETISLKQYYPGLQDLFFNKLGIQNATGLDVANELGRFSNDVSKFHQIKELLLWLSGCIDTKMWHADITKSLGDKTIFPVTNVTKHLRASVDTDWFIADKPKLERCFRDKVALLDFTRDELTQLWPLLVKLLVHRRTLTIASRESNDAYGALSLDKALTNRLRSKAIYISSLAEPSRFTEVMCRAEKIEVWHADVVKVRRYVVVHETKIHGNHDPGYVVINEDETTGVIRVHISKEDAAKQLLPAFPLTERLLARFKLPKKVERLLMPILLTDNEAAIEDCLDRAGIEIPTKDLLIEQQIEQQSLDAADDNFGTPSVQDVASRMAPPTFPSTDFKEQLSDAKRNAKGLSSSVHLRSIQEAISYKQPPSTTAEGRQTLLDSDKRMQSIQFTSDAYVGVKGRRIKPVLEKTRRNAFPANPSLASKGATTGVSPSAGLHAYLTAGGKAGATSTKDVITKGQLFIFNFLKETFQATDNCWTRKMREQYDVKPFHEDESTYSDFTIYDFTVSERITHWLIENGCTVAEGFHGKHIIYHFQVNATAGRCNEPFDMSTTELNLAQAWHESDQDVCVVLRVYDLQSSPKVRAYVDPIELEESGEFNIVPQGYTVELR